MLPIPMNEHLYEVMYQWAKKNSLNAHKMHAYFVVVIDLATATGKDQKQIWEELIGLSGAIKEAANTIKPKTYVYSEGTPEQRKKIEELISDGYIWNEKDSVAAAGVVLDKGDDRWFFGLQGEIVHDPMVKMNTL